MQSNIVDLSDIVLVGLTARTNNQNEMNPKLSKIGGLANHYWGNQIANQFTHRINPGMTYAVYTDFESDEHGEYTYFIGEAVSSLKGQDLSEFKTLDIAASRYEKFTSNAGTMPDIVITSWQEIWKKPPQDFAGKRQYIADFEVYDQRAADPTNAVIDIYIGIQ